MKIKKQPKIKPTKIGKIGVTPLSSAISQAGIISDQIEAAIIIPEEKPKHNFKKVGLIPLIKNTTQEPSTVAKNVIEVPINTYK